MKILSFSYCFPNEYNPNWGIFVYQRLTALSKLEDLQVCSPVPWFPGFKKKSMTPGIQHWRDLLVHRPHFFYFPGLFKNYDAIFYARGLKKWFKKLCSFWQPDLLDAHFVWPDGVGVALLAKQFGLPYTITLRGKIYECLKVPNQTRQCTQAFQGAAAVISVSSKMADEAVRLGVPENRLHVIPNGVDKDHFKPHDKRACRKRLGLPEDGKIIVTVAHLGQRKGHHEMIAALAGLPEEVFLVIIGGAAQGGTAESLRKVAQKANVASRLILPGPQSYEQIPYYFSAADASVLASYREGCPNAVLESLACGTPVIASDVGAVPDILPVPEAGRIVVPREVEPLCRAISEVLEKSWNPEEVVSRSGVREWSQVADDVRHVFKQII